MRKNITLIGFMGAGKSSIGKTLANDIKFELIDIDFEIERQENLTISKIFSLHGEKYFRDLENSYISSLKNVENKIISLGGGAYCNEDNIKILREISFTIYLKTSYESILKRLSEEELIKRPLLKDKSNVENLLNSREKFYRQVDLILSTDNKTILEICNEILGYIR